MIMVYTAQTFNAHCSSFPLPALGNAHYIRWRNTIILADQAEMASQDTLVNPYQTQTLSSGAIYMPSPGCIP